MRVTGATTRRAPATRCKTADCDRTDGIMGRCTSHTPSKGNGWIKCRRCGESLSKHDLAKPCRPDR
jgi:hypothetical protein